MRTTDSKAFMTRLNALTARGGGDSAEMSLSALKVLHANTGPTNPLLLAFRIGGIAICNPFQFNSIQFYLYSP